MNVKTSGPELVEKLGLPADLAKALVHKLANNLALKTDFDAWVETTRRCEHSLDECLSHPDAVTKKRAALAKLKEAQEMAAQADAC